MESRYFVLTLKSEPKQESWSGGFEGARGGLEGAYDEMPMGSALGSSSGAEPAGAAEIAIETTTLTEKQARAAARDPQTTLAEEMPVALIEPMQSLSNGGDGDPLALAMAAKSSWGIAGVGADKTQLTGAGVTVAVLDTGIDANHKAFAGMNLIRQNFAGGDPSDAHDRQGHGTHCAGTIFGRDVDGLRIGVARGVTKAVIGKVLDDQGRGSTIAVLNALQWAQQQGAQIVSMSLGFDFPAMQQRLVDAGKPMKLATSQALKAYRENLRLFERLFDFLMLQNFMSPGMIVVAASGNESMREAMPPFLIDASLPAASSPHIISVGAFARRADRFSIAPFSNINPVLAAPGVDIVSAKTGGGLTAMNGTSMACPHVAGLAALWWEWVAKNQGRATGDLVRARVVGSALASGFAGDVTFEDRGGGCPMAPV